MTPADVQYRHQARLWSAAFGVSALINAIVVILIAAWISLRVVILTALGIDPASFVTPALPPPRLETVATIIPEVVASASAVTTERRSSPSYIRTSADQEAARPEHAALFGERNTRATSDAAAVARAPAIPSQKGDAPHRETETTASDFLPGSEAGGAPEQVPAEGEAAAEAAPGAFPQEAAAGRKTSASNPATAPGSSAPPRVPLAQGPLPVERQVKDEIPPELPKPPEPDPRSATPPGESETSPPADAPALSPRQAKTQLRGSITRQGSSAVDVEGSPLGMYQASVGRVIDKEWQLACVRNQNYITAGHLVVRLVLEPGGKVRSLTFVEEAGVGDIQKGFTLESIRTALIPAFPAEVKKKLAGGPLELTYIFTF